MTPRLAQTLAVRVDHLALKHSGPLVMPGPGRTQDAYDRRRITGVSFNSGLVWRATDADTLRLTLARGLQAPSLTALGHQTAAPASGGGPAVAFLGAPGLNPSAVWHAEVGYDRRVDVLASTLRVAVFAQRTSDVIADPFAAEPVFTGRGLVFRSANIGRSSAAGGEIGVRGQAQSWRWNASYAAIRIRDHLDASGPLLWLDFRRGTPAHIVRVGGGYTWGRVEADLQGRWQSRYRDYRAGANFSGLTSISVPDYLQLDARVGYRVVEGMMVALTATQFNVSRLVQTAGRPVERRLFLSATARF